MNVVDSIAAKLMDSPGNSTDEEEEEQESPSQVPELRFSISTYHHRVKKDGLSYDKKLSRSESLNLAPSVKPRNLLNSTSSTSHAHPAQLTKSESFRSLNKRHSDPEMNTPEGKPSPFSHYFPIQSFFLIFFFKFTHVFEHNNKINIPFHLN